MVYIRPNAYFPLIQNIFDENGTMKPEHETPYTKSVQGVYKELLWFARALKAAR
jgi:hypothetical protein